MWVLMKIDDENLFVVLDFTMVRKKLVDTAKERKEIKLRSFVF